MEKRQFEEMNLRMEEEKRKVNLEREKIEHEIKSIRALNEDLYRQNYVQAAQLGVSTDEWARKKQKVAQIERYRIIIK